MLINVYSRNKPTVSEINIELPPPLLINCFLHIAQVAPDKQLINSYSSRTRRIWADIYNQRGRRPLLSAHIRQVREE